jgi:hypothetical protein
VVEGRLRAWIETRDGRPGVIAAFVGVPPGSNAPIRRLPATKHFCSCAEAMRWVESEALALGSGVRVERASAPP